MKPTPSPTPVRIANWNPRRRALFLVLGLTLSVPSALAQIELQRTADLIVINARVWLGTEPRNQPPDGKDHLKAITVIDGRISAVLPLKEARDHIGPATTVVNARSRRVIPGITDSHTHLISGGLQLTRLQLRDVKNRDEFVKAVADAAKEKKKGEWVLGGRWSVESWDKPEAPTRQWLDPVTAETPVFLWRMDGHQALVNSAALKLAGIDAAGPTDPKGGEIERDPKTREPTGVLKESAMDLVERRIPEPTQEERLEALKRAMKHANSFGITSVHDMSDANDMQVFARAEQEKSLSLRVTSYVQSSDPRDWRDINQRLSSPFNSEWVRVAGLKGYMDGSLGSRTAYMREPYADATKDMPYPRGQLTDLADPPEEFAELVTTVDSGKWQIAAHAIGDQANHLVLNAYEAAMKKNGRSDARHRIEHAQHLLLEDIPRFGKLGVVASMQPYHKADDSRYAEKAIGSERLKGSYAFRQLVDSNALLVFGSDWPVVTLDPFAGIDSAVNARTLAGDVWLPSHSLTVTEALYAYTVAPAKAIHRDDRLGTIEVGKLADVVILAPDPFAIPKERLAEVKVTHTIVGGRVVFEQEPPKQ